MEKLSKYMDNPVVNGAENNLEKLILNLASEDSDIREKARYILVRKGKSVIPDLANYIHSKNNVLRWEVAKTLGEMETPSAIPLLIKILEDNISSIRWLAAEGLVRVGAPAIKPLLEELIEKPDSVLLRDGAHHIFKEFVKHQHKKQLQPLLTALEATGISEQVPVVADEILKKYYSK